MWGESVLTLFIVIDCLWLPMKIKLQLINFLVSIN